MSYGFEYAYMMESSKENSDLSVVTDRLDAFEWYLKLGAVSNIDKLLLHGKLPTWNDFVEHPNYDAFWKRQGKISFLGEAIRVSMEFYRVIL